ncbi:OXR1 protein, partial [Amia calva]|nr:OXR1 protein [Amia calva]
MEPRPHREKHRSYFSNVKTRLGAKLPTNAQPLELLAHPWEQHHGGPQTGVGSGAWGGPPSVVRGDTDTAFRSQKTSGSKTPVIRNPQLRKYYLREMAPLRENTKGKPASPETSEGVAEYTVHPEDTVFSLASQCHSTPSQLVNHNRPSSHTLLPAQRLSIPDRKPSSLPQAVPPDPSDSVPSSPSCSPSPDADYDQLLDVETVPMPDGQLCLLALPSECDPAQGEGPTTMHYLKLCCRYITDRKGVVSGILLVTPNKIFFDPYKSHPLVMEHGCEEYLLSCSVDSILSASFFSDISRVHFNTASARPRSRKKVQKPKALGLLRHSRSGGAVSEVKPSTPSAPQGDKIHTPPLASDTHDRGLSSALRRKLSLEDGGPRGRGKVAHSVEAETLGGLAAAWGFHSDRASGETLQEAEAGALGVLSSAATFCCGGLDVGGRARAEPANSEAPQRQSAGTMLSGPACLPPGRSALMFLRLRLAVSPRKRVLFTPQPPTAKGPATKDAWFTLSQESSDELYAYLSQQRPDLCLLEGGEDEDEDEEFVLVDEKEEVSPSESRTGEDWEMVSVDDGAARSLILDKEPEGLDDILEKTNILEAADIQQISNHLPPRTVGHSWKLTYSTSVHGSSLKTLYRKLAHSESPGLLVIKDFHNQVFGSFMSHSLRPSETFYGTGETFLFTFYPEFKCFYWTGENSFFIKGDLDSIAIGGGSGHFGLWLDENLYLGRSSSCSTFNNSPLSKTDDFRVMEIEVWTFY